MRKSIGWLLAALLFLWPLAASAKPDRKSKPAPAPAFAKGEDILKWINEYRSAPDPARLPQAVKAMGDLGLLREIDNAGVYIGFTAGVIGSNPDQAQSLITKMFPMPPEDQVALIKAIAFSGLENWKELLSSISERMPARTVLVRKYLYGDGKTLDALPLDEGSFVLDCHWGYYFATGSAKPVRRILEALAWSTNKDDVEKLTMGSMAKWTLASNASRDRDLLDIMKAELNTQPKAVTGPLREVIEAAETYETSRIRKEALAAIDELKLKGPQKNRDYAWWGQAGQTALALGCVAASALGQVQIGIPCVIGGAVSSAALKFLTPQ
jgi:hypothetical protein